MQKGKSSLNIRLWILLFSLILVLIPYLIYIGQIKGAKLAGIALVILVTWRIRLWIYQLKELKGRPDKINLNANDLFFLEKEIAFYRSLNKSEKKVFEERIALFLTSVRITEINQDIPDRDTCLWVASSAVITFWGLPFWNYGRLSEVLVYPSRFDDTQELNHNGRVLGKVFHGGLMDTTMILSKPDLIHGFKDNKDKVNVGIHEFAHLLDKADGIIDGLPEGMNLSLEKAWEHICAEEMKEIYSGNSDINKYAGENKAEFFAVLVEYYKEQPTILQKKYPEIHAILDQYFQSN